MRKKIVWGSVVVALLMLVSTQIVFLNIVRSSDPTAHEGDADVGDLWITELDVSSDLATIDYIGISHANATDDWVIWTDGTGNINASWDVDIEARNHPEYYVTFMLHVYIFDPVGNSSELGNDTFSKTYTEGLEYDESGTLSVAVQFTQQQQQAGYHPLVCYLGAYARINDTIEAVNFTSNAEDRCVVAVDFSTPERYPPFSKYRDEANDNYPNMWSWLPGWADIGRFSDEDDMLNTQTFVKVGASTVGGYSGNDEWDLGDVTIDLKPNGVHVHPFSKNSYGFDVGDPSGDFTIDCFIDVTVNYYGGLRHGIFTRCELWKEDISLAWFWGDGIYWCPAGQTTRCEYRIEANRNDDTIPPEDIILLRGFFWTGVFPFPAPRIGWFAIVFDQGDDKGYSSQGQTSINWEESCAYENNSSFDINPSNSTSQGVTTVTIDISDALDSNNEIVYTFAGDRSDTRVQLTC